MGEEMKLFSQGNSFIQLVSWAHLSNTCLKWAVIYQKAKHTQTHTCTHPHSGIHTYLNTQTHAYFYKPTYTHKHTHFHTHVLLKHMYNEEKLQTPYRNCFEKVKFWNKCDYIRIEIPWFNVRGFLSDIVKPRYNFSRAIHDYSTVYLDLCL